MVLTSSQPPRMPDGSSRNIQPGRTAAAVATYDQHKECPARMPFSETDNTLTASLPSTRKTQLLKLISYTQKSQKLPKLGPLSPVILEQYCVFIDSEVRLKCRSNSKQPRNHLEGPTQLQPGLPGLPSLD